MKHIKSGREQKSPSNCSTYYRICQEWKETVMFIIALWHEEQKVINVKEQQGSGEELVMTFLWGDYKNPNLQIQDIEFLISL